MSKEMVTIETGKVYPGFKPGLPERTLFDMTDSGGIYFLFYDTPTKTEIEQTKSGKAKIGIAHIRGLNFVMLKLGTGPWMDAPYHSHFSKPFKYQKIEAEDKETGYTLSIVMIDNKTGIVKVIRLVTMPNAVSKNLSLSIGLERSFEACGMEFNAKKYDEMLAEVYRKLTTNQMLMYADTYEVGE